MSWSRGVAAFGLVIVLGSGVAAAQTEPTPTIGDRCAGVDHPPFSGEEPTDDESFASMLRFYGFLVDAPEGAESATLTVEDPSGQLLTGTGTVDDQARFGAIVGIDQFGEHTVRGPLTLGTPDGDVTVDGLDGVVVDVGPEEPPCTREQFPAGSFAAPPTTTTSAPATTAPTTTAPPASVTTVTTIVVGEDDSGSFSTVFILPILIGGVLILVGVVTYYRTRERGRSQPPGDLDLGGKPPPFPVGFGHGDGDDDPTPYCEWNAYYDDGTTRTPLRETTGHECCVYTVRVSSARTGGDFASSIRQDGDDRLRIIDHDLTYQGLDVHGSASVRSGPAGRLDWMQGETLKPVRIPEGVQPNESYRWQLRSHEERPDVAVHQSYDEQTTITITLDSGCEGHVSSYTAEGRTTALVQANGECTNTEPGPECPVELTATTWSAAAVRGDLGYRVDATAAGDADELEGQGGLDVREVGGVTHYGSHRDSHDHVTPSETYEIELTGGATSTTVAESFSMVVTHALVLDAGSIVPTRVHATTDRVSADAYVHFDHDISVLGHSTTLCFGTDCCGHGGCSCDPTVVVFFRDHRAWIECDRKSFPINRNNLNTGLGMALGADAPWELG